MCLSGGLCFSWAAVCARESHLTGLRGANKCACHEPGARPAGLPIRAEIANEIFSNMPVPGARKLRASTDARRKTPVCRGAPPGATGWVIGKSVGMSISSKHRSGTFGGGHGDAPASHQVQRDLSRAPRRNLGAPCRQPVRAERPGQNQPVFRAPGSGKAARRGPRIAPRSSSSERARWRRRWAAPCRP